MHADETTLQVLNIYKSKCYAMLRLEKMYRENKFTFDEIKKLRNKGKFKEHLDNVFKIIEKASPETKRQLIIFLKEKLPS